MHRTRNNKCIGRKKRVGLASTWSKLPWRDCNDPHWHYANTCRFSSRNNLPASDRAGARRRGDRVERDRTERDGSPSQFDPAIARARDCPRCDLRRGTRRRPQGRRLRGRRRGAGRNLGGGRGCRGRSREPGAARAGGAAHAGCGPERQPVGDRRWTRQDRRHRARPANRRKNRGATQQRWRRCEGRVHPKSGPGLYQLTPPQSLPAILAQWGSVTPFVLRSRSRSGLERRARRHDGAVRA